MLAKRRGSRKELSLLQLPLQACEKLIKVSQIMLVKIDSNYVAEVEDKMLAICVQERIRL
jgi:hypothetical protein